MYFLLDDLPHLNVKNIVFECLRLGEEICNRLLVHVKFQFCMCGIKNNHLAQNAMLINFINNIYQRQFVTCY